MPVTLHFSIFNELWFQDLILALSALIAIVTIKSASLHERRRATVDIVRDQLKDERLIAARLLIRTMKNSGGIDAKTLLVPADSPEQQAFFTLLNSYEFMATGLRTGAFDRKTYKRMYYNNVIDSWNMLEDFVLQYREKYEREHGGSGAQRAETLFQDFESLARKWKKRPLRTLR